MSEVELSETEVLKKYKRKTFLEHLVGPVGSGILHVVLFLILIRLVVGKKGAEGEAQVEVMIMDQQNVELDDFNKEIEKIQELQQLDDVVTPPPDVTVSVDSPPVAGEGAGAAGAGVGAGPGGFDDAGMEANAVNILNSSGPLVMKGLYAGRSTGGRAAALGSYGGKWGAFTEASVIKALEWLKNHQLPDGSWEPKSDAPAMTGLALLAFLAHGETTSSEKYGPTVEKAIRFLVSQQKEGGEFTALNQHGVYEHAIATYGISEAYGLTRIPSLKPVMEKAVGVILRGQQAGGSWDYFYKKEARQDLSVAGWHIQALKAAYIAGAENEGLHDAIEKAVANVKTFQNPEHGLFGYTDNKIGAGMRPSLTGVAVLCMQLTGHGEDSEAKKGLAAIQNLGCDWANPTDWPMYAWYYITQAKFQKGGSEWQAWNNSFAREFTKNQQEDGHWNTPAPQGKPESGMNPVYSTALAALTLQVYYRFLPTYKPIKIEAPVEKPADEISVEII